jgi:hypothetical protein
VLPVTGGLRVPVDVEIRQGAVVAAVASLVLGVAR